MSCSASDFGLHPRLIAPTEVFAEFHVHRIVVNEQIVILSHKFKIARVTVPMGAFPAPCIRGGAAPILRTDAIRCCSGCGFVPTTASRASARLSWVIRSSLLIVLSNAPRAIGNTRVPWYLISNRKPSLAKPSESDCLVARFVAFAALEWARFGTCRGR